MTYPKWKREVRKARKNKNKSKQREQIVTLSHHEVHVYQEWDTYKKGVKKL